MRRTADEVIKDYVSRGYELVSKSGDANAVEKLRLEYKSNGFDARWWTLNDAESGKYHVLYAKKRAPRTKKTVSYDNLTVKELKNLCSERKIPKYSKMNKDQMVAALSA